MAEGSDSYHEPRDMLAERTILMHQAIVSLTEELEAVDWYQQRADACSDEALKKILIHNRDEEIEHAMMALEWIRRHDDVFDQEMRTYLFTDGPITDVEADATGAAPDGDHEGAAGEDPGSAPRPVGDHNSLGIGSLKEADA